MPVPTCPAVARLIPTWLLLGALALAASAFGQTPVAVPSDPSNFHLFLLLGQSNMAGRGRVEPQDQQTHPRVLTLDRDGDWVPAVDPLHFDKPGIAGVGLGRTFALDYSRQYPDVTVGLIPCAVGGSPIASWEPGGYHLQTKTHPYDEAILRAKRALATGTLHGILWHQGESDAKPELAEVYEEKLGVLVARLRKELDAPQVPFIVGQMGEFAERPWNDSKMRVDAAHRALPRNVAQTAFVLSDGLSHKGDAVHFDTPSYHRLGHRYFQAWLKLSGDEASSQLHFDLERSVVQNGFDARRCWVHARAGAVPPHSTLNPSPQPLVVMTAQQLLLSGSDVFYALHGWRTNDLGRSWSDPKRFNSFIRKQVPPNDRQVTVCDFTPQWHAKTGTLLGIGQTVWYEDNRVMHVRPRATAYAVYDPVKNDWSDWRRLELPDEPQFKNSGSGSVQRLDLKNGEILLPIYYKEPEERQYSATICRCTFDGQTLRYSGHGDALTVDVQRGLCEPSITQYGGRFYLTMRNDERGYVAVSKDGLHFESIRVWTFDDGTELGNYNTQQHWVTHSDGLYLVYTRRGANNDHVFRHRAPLFIAQVDTQNLCIMRHTEQVLVPQRGARLGNFGVTDVSPHQTWVTVTEWMQPAGCERYGSDNSIFVAKLNWNRPNQLLIDDE